MTIFKAWIYHFIVLCIAMFFTSCGGNKACIDQKDIYFANNPELAGNYSNFSITSFESRKKYLDNEFALVTTLLSIIEGKHPESKSTIKEIRRKYKEEYKFKLKNFFGMNMTEVEPGDSLYLYEFNINEHKTEYGLIVLNEGKLRKKFIDLICEEN